MTQNISSEPLISQVLPASSPQEDGIEILVRLAKTGQIDPWNIDIAEVADQYLRAVAELKSSDLQVTGKTLLFLAILLRMKSDQLAGKVFLEPEIEDNDLDDFSMDFLPPPEFLANQPKRSLEEVIQRRTSIKQPRIRRVTLQDLIVELKKYEALERERSLRETAERAEKRRNIRDYSELTADDIEEMAHEESIEDTIYVLQGLLEKLFTGKQQVSLSDLENDGGIDRVSAFLALLFLTSRGEVELFQDAFYTELYVSSASPADDNVPMPATPETDVA